MKKFIALIAVIVMQSCTLIYNQKTNDPTKQPPPSLEVTSNTNENDEWGIFIEALICIESSGNEFAVGSKNDVGVLQITPIYVKDVNRILGKKAYTLSCRTDALKSLEMFAVIQEHYNPQKSIEKAIKLHNPLAPDSYREKIVNKMEEIKRNTQGHNNI